MATIGQLSGISAWVDKTPPGPPTLHVIGMVGAPTPCHVADAAYVGDSKDLPPKLILKISVRDVGATCLQVVSDIPFRYKGDNYNGTHRFVEVSSGDDSQIVEIQIVQ